MTKFKFRVWDKEEKHMHYMPAAELYEVLFLRADGVLCDVDESAMHSNGYSKDPRPAYEKYEVSFSTGLKDCEGQEIWEGDVIGYIFEEKILCKYHVEYRKCCFYGTALQGIYKDYMLYDLIHAMYPENKFKVIGNRFTNPELLEQ